MLLREKENKSIFTLNATVLTEDYGNVKDQQQRL